MCAFIADFSFIVFISLIFFVIPHCLLSSSFNAPFSRVFCSPKNKNRIKSNFYVINVCKTLSKHNYSTLMTSQFSHSTKHKNGNRRWYANVSVCVLCVAQFEIIVEHSFHMVGTKITATEKRDSW